MGEEYLDWDIEPEREKLELFTNRHQFIRLFAEYLNDDTPRKTIIYLYSEGGNGKSLLLKFLREHCCYCLPKETWKKLKDQPEVDIVEEIKKANQRNESVKIPVVLHSFEHLPGGDKPYQNIFDHLLHLRRKLAESGQELGYKLKFPFYDYACVLYLCKKGKPIQEIRKLFPLNEIVGLVASSIDAITKNPIASIGKGVLDIFAKDMGEKFTFYVQKIGLDKAIVDKISQFDPDRELIEYLPMLFAKDLNVTIQQNQLLSRIILLFDAHQDIWDYPYLPEETFFYKDEWLRRLLYNLKRELGIVVVIAGRQKPLWPEASKFKIPLEDLDLKNLGNLPQVNAKEFLKKKGIKDDIATAIINGTMDSNKEVQPLLLAGCAEAIIDYAKTGPLDYKDIIPQILTEKLKGLRNLLLKYVDEHTRDAIYALSACRAFNIDLYMKLREKIPLSGTYTSFQNLLCRSFVLKDERKDGWYRIHDLIRQFDYNDNNIITQKAHQLLEEHYRKKGNLAEAIYHTACQDWKKGAGQWTKEMSNAQNGSNIELCHKLMEIQPELMKLRRKNYS